MFVTSSKSRLSPPSSYMTTWVRYPSAKFSIASLGEEVWCTVKPCRDFSLRRRFCGSLNAVTILLASQGRTFFLPWPGTILSGLFSIQKQVLELESPKEVLLFYYRWGISILQISVSSDLVYKFFCELHLGMNIVSYDQRKHYSEKAKLRNIDLDRGKVQSKFYTQVAPHIVDSDPFPPGNWRIWVKTIKKSVSFKTRDYTESNKKWRVYSLKNTRQFLETAKFFSFWVLDSLI